MLATIVLSLRAYTPTEAGSGSNKLITETLLSCHIVVNNWLERLKSLPNSFFVGGDHAFLEFLDFI